MDVVDLGGARLHVLTVLPGRPGEADRAYREVVRADPAVVLADMDTDECLRLLEALGRDKRPWALSFVDALAQDETHRRLGDGDSAGEHPLQAAARAARKAHASFIPLRPVAKDPGFLGRRRGRRAVREVADLPADELGPALAKALSGANAWSAAADAEAARPRLMRALTEGRAPVVAVLQAHRAPAYRDLLGLVGRVHA